MYVYGSECTLTLGLENLQTVLSYSFETVGLIFFRGVWVVLV